MFNTSSFLYQILFSLSSNTGLLENSVAENFVVPIAVLDIFITHPRGFLAKLATAVLFRAGE